MSRTNEMEWLKDKHEKQEEDKGRKDVLGTLVEFLNVQLSSPRPSPYFKLHFGAESGD
jgi:hypothetical protein